MSGSPFVLELPSPPALRPRLWHGFLLAALVLFTGTLADAATPAAQRAGIFGTLLKWTPLLFQGFVFNIAISLFAMLIGTVLGTLLGLTLISLHVQLRRAGAGVMQFFRNIPWLVLLFFVMYLFPFHLSVGPVSVPLPGWFKAVLGLSLPVMANVAEIMRGAVRSIPAGQWEAAESLAFNRRQQVFGIILPQCVKRMLPPWMNLYAIVAMSTVLSSIIGVTEVMTLAGQVSAAEGGRTDLLAPLYGYILLWFFIYTYPIAVLTSRFERRFNVKA
jgi:polar amino acid transport system permease protein